MTRAQLRKQGGVPDGGQFATDPRPEADAELEYTVDDEVDDLLQDGSFEFPPAYFSEAAVLIRFWQRVPVSDTVLERIGLNYTAQVRIWAQSQLGAWERANPRPAEKTGFGAKQSQANLAAWAQARAAEQTRIAGLHREFVPDSHVRVMARIAQMYRSINTFEPGSPDIQIVLDYPVMIGPHNHGSVEEFTRRWLLDKIPANAFKDPTRHMPDQLDAMVTEQRKSTDRLDALQSELYRMSALQNMDPAQYAREAAKHGW